MGHYFDTSALAKLIVAEPETDALRAWLLAEKPEAFASDLVRPELLRAVRRAAPDRMSQTREVLDGLLLISCTAAIFESAARLNPVLLRSLDAIHLATALVMGDELDSVVTYDAGLAAACRENGVMVLAPG